MNRRPGTSFKLKQMGLPTFKKRPTCQKCHRLLSTLWQYGVCKGCMIELSK